MKKNNGGLDSVLGEINSKFGKGSAIVFGDSDRSDIDVIPTGSIDLDAKLGIGGWPRGRITELSGNNQSGKTTLVIHAMKNAQEMGLKVAFIDMEHAFEPNWAETIGVDVDSMVFCQPDSGEEALQVCSMLVESGEFGLVILDSVGALVPKAELDGDIGDSHIGLVARMMGQSLRKISPAVSRTNTSLIFINQIRANIGVQGYGPQTTTTGGKSLPFYASIRGTVSRTGGIKGKTEGEMIGSTVKVKIAKNKLSAPFKTANLDLMFDSGFCPFREVIEIASKSGIIKKGGAWYTLPEDLGGDKFQGQVALTTHLKENEDKYNSIRSMITGD